VEGHRSALGVHVGPFNSSISGSRPRSQLKRNAHAIFFVVGVSRGPGTKRPRSSLTNTELVALACDRDSDAWSEIVRRYEGLVWSIALGHSFRSGDAADIAQTVWLRLAQHLSRLTNPEGIKSWLVLTTRNECFRVSRQRSRTIPVDVADARVFADQAGPVDDLTRLEDLEESHALWEAFLRMPATCQSLLGLLNADPRPSYVEVADRCGIAIGTIGSRRRRCLESLREALQDNPAISHGGPRECL
jgi:RNA polymerase sigma factor (sigma-70 family)